jgi:thioesterase domain-containing protein
LTSGTRDTNPLTVASITDACFREISAVQQHGPYYLAGYSFGGLVAIEVARFLKNSAQEVGLLALIDTIYDHRYWPKSQFLISQARRICWHVRRIGTLPLREATSEFNRLRLRLHHRRERLTPSEPSLTTASAESVQERCSAAIKCYIPAHSSGKIIVFRTEDEDFACDPTHLWHKFADTIESHTIPRSHFDIVRNGNSVSRLATELDASLDSVEA